MSSPLPEGVEMVVNTKEIRGRELRSSKKNSDPRDDCERCKQGFATLGMLQSHIMAEHSNTAAQSQATVPQLRPRAKSLISCHLCGSTFTTKGSLRVHMRMHTGSKPFDCPQCEKSFRTSGHRKSHILSTHRRKSTRSKKTRIQELTDYSLDFNSENSLEQPDDDNINKFCDICNKSFDKPSQLTRHNRMHSGVKPYVCDICSKSFTQKNGLTTHMLTHSGIKPHQCSHCGKTFSQPGNLKAHIQRMHSDLLSGIIVQYMQQE